MLIIFFKNYEARNWCGAERDRVGSGEEKVQVSEGSEGGGQRSH